MFSKSVYEIVPETDLPGYDLKNINGVGIKKCRAMCDDNRECEAFVWQEVNKSGVCTLKKNSDVQRKWNSSTVLYIKRGNPSYWLLWLFLILLGIVIFISKGRKKY